MNYIVLIKYNDPNWVFGLGIGTLRYFAAPKMYGLLITFSLIMLEFPSGLNPDLKLRKKGLSIILKLDLAFNNVKPKDKYFDFD